MRILAFAIITLLVNNTFSQQVKISSTGSAGVYALTFPANFTLTPGIEFTFEANHTNTGPSSLNVNGVGGLSIYKQGSTPLAAGDIVSGQMVKVIFDGAFFQLLSPVATSTSSTAWSLTGNTGINSTTNYIGTNDGADLVFKTSGTEAMRIGSGGFIGIGTSNPQSLLHLEKQTTDIRLKSSLSTSFANAYIDFGRDDGFGGFLRTGYIGHLGGGDFLTLGSPQAIAFNTNYTERLTITNSGNVGIGTSSPGALLDVNGHMNLQGSLMTGYNAGALGDVLQSNGFGTPPSWVPLSSIDAANRTLSNLNATSINQSLIPNSSNSHDLGMSTLSWNDLYLDGRLYINNEPWTSISVNNTFIGTRTNESVTSGMYNVGVGPFSGYKITSGFRNTTLGHVAGQNLTTSSDNTLIGAWSAGIASNLGGENTFVGAYTGYTSNNSGSYNTLMGVSSGQSITTGSWNTYLGHSSAISANSGISNVALGQSSGVNLTSGNNNTFIGVNSGFAGATQYTNATAIGYYARVGASNSMVLGGTGSEAVFVGINTTTPTQRLHVEGNLRLQGALMPNNNAGTAGQVLTSAGAGLPPTWSTAATYTASNGLNISGSTINLGGTLNQNTTVNMSTFNMAFTGSGSVGIKTSTPSATLHVHEISGASQFRLTNNLTGTTSIDGFTISSGGSSDIYFSQHENADMNFSTNSALNMTLKPGGNVGVKTTTPASALSVSGEVSIGNTFSNTAAPANGLIVEGNLGVGTTNPGLSGLYQAQTLGTSKKVLSISSIVNYTDQAPAVIELKGSSGTAGDEIGVIDFINRSSGNQDYNFARIAAKWMGTNVTYSGLSFSTRNGSTLSEKMLIDHLGNVGIGTSAAASRLDVNGTITLSGGITSEIRRTNTGAANLIPIAYGYVYATGALGSGTGNYTVTKAGVGIYDITITGFSYVVTTHVTNASIAGASVAFISTTSSAGNLRVHTYNITGAAADLPFHFTVFKP